MKIGIYLGYGPSLKLSLINEGLGRYLAQLIKVFDQEKCSLTIACPNWLLEPLEQLFLEYNFSFDNIEIVSPRVTPVLWRVYELRNRKKVVKTSKFKKIFLQASYSITESFINLLTRTKNYIVFFMLLLLLGAFIILSIPIIFIGTCMLFLLKFVKKILNVNFKSEKLKRFYRKITTIKPGLRPYFDYLKDLRFSGEILDKIRLSSAREIIERINRMKAPADVWYCPMAFWPEFNEISSTRVICFPDLTPAVFFEDFSGMGMGETVKKIRETVRDGNYFITYCEYQRKAMLSEQLGKNLENIRAIHLFVNETLPYIDVKNAYPSYYKKNANLKFARMVLNTLLANAPLDVIPYLTGGDKYFSFNDMKYVFYSSQCRPNKNVMTLVKAYEYLLRKKEISFKLVLTGLLDHDQEVKNYVYKNRLQYDILSFYNVNNQQLACLYACAEVVVNPTLYEGGFLMIFSEGMSVGTPSVMGRIPQVIEVTKDYELDDCLFDPFDYKDIADKIIYGIEHRNEIFERQKKLYDKLSARTKYEAGKEYIAAFNYFIEMDKRGSYNNENDR